METTLQYTPLTLADSAEFFLLAGNERVAATMRFDCPQTRAESDAVLAAYIAAGNRAFAIRSQPGTPLWGVFAFKVNPASDAADLSQMMLPQKWGQGLGKQVLSDMIRLAQKEQWYKALEGYVLETNIASRRMAERLGFFEKQRHRFDGMTEDLIVYRLEL